MKIREYTVVETPSFIITARKVTQTRKDFVDEDGNKRKYKVTYNISIYDRNKDHHISRVCNSRKEAKEEMKRLLRLHTSLSATDILRGLWK